MLKRITLEVDGKEITLTAEEAQNLYIALDNVFGKRSGVQFLAPYNFPHVTWCNSEGTTFTNGNKQ